MATTEGTYTVAHHFEGRDPAVREIYRAILANARHLGPVHEEAKKTSIHLTKETAFAGVATRKSALILTLKVASDIQSGRVIRRERVSVNRWHVEIRLGSPDEVDAELLGWLRQAYALAT